MEFTGLNGVSFNKLFAEFALKHMGIEHRHFACHYGERQSVTIAPLAIAGKRTYAVRVRQRAGLALYLATEVWRRQFSSKCAINARNRQEFAQLRIYGRILVALAQNGG